MHCIWLRTIARRREITSRTTPSRKCGDECRPAAHLVLHTWNQRLGHHPHIHALVPGGGLSLDGQRWISSKDPDQPRRRKPFLTDYNQLGAEFRKQFVNGLRRLIRGGKLRLEDEFAVLNNDEHRERWLDELKSSDWNVFIEGPPHGRSRAEHVIKYLARYISGGPIADRRLISDKAGQVTFWARSPDKQQGNPPEELELGGPEFVRRWTMHILPKNYTRSRSYGQFHGSQRKAYLAQARQALNIPDVDAEPTASLEELEAANLPRCPHCDIPMDRIEATSRPSWRDVFDVLIYREQKLYSPAFYILNTNLRPAHATGEYG